MKENIKQRVAKFASCLEELLRRFNTLAVKESQRRKMASHLIPELAEKLVIKGIVSPASKKLVEEELQDHRKTLILLEKVAEKVRPGSFGTAIGSSKKSGSYIIGQYIPEDERESGRLFKEAFLKRMS